MIAQAVVSLAILFGQCGTDTECSELGTEIAWTQIQADPAALAEARALAREATAEAIADGYAPAPEGLEYDLADTSWGKALDARFSDGYAEIQWFEIAARVLNCRDDGQNGVICAGVR